MPAWVTMIISTRPRSPDSIRVFMSPSSTDWKGSVYFHSGCRGASAFTRSSAKAIWTYIGCSTHSVPSLSKVAMRSAGTTKSGPALVTRPTNSTMACFVGVSFHDGNGSPWASVGNDQPKLSAAPRTAPANTSKNLRFIWLIPRADYAVFKPAEVEAWRRATVTVYAIPAASWCRSNDLILPGAATRSVYAIFSVSRPFLHIRCIEAPSTTLHSAVFHVKAALLTYAVAAR